MNFNLVQFSGGLKDLAYQVIVEGAVIGYYLEDGTLIDISEDEIYECSIVKENVDVPEWSDKISTPKKEVYQLWSTWNTSEFLERFTQKEYRDIMSASLQNPDILGLSMKLSTHDLIYAASPELNYGLNVLISLGILTPTRKKEILEGYEE